jgi:hypothetical protein
MRTQNCETSKAVKNPFLGRSRAVEDRATDNLRVEDPAFSLTTPHRINEGTSKIPHLAQSANTVFNPFLGIGVSPMKWASNDVPSRLGFPAIKKIILPLPSVAFRCLPAKEGAESKADTRPDNSR